MGNYSLQVTVYRFCCFCNQVLPKTLRFSLQRHKAAKSYAFCDSLPVSCLYCFCCFGKAGQTSLLKKRENLRERGNQRFRCVGFPSPLDPHPFLTPTRGAPLDPRTPFLFFATGGLGLWLEVFDKSGFFRCQSRLRNSAFWLTNSA